MSHADMITLFGNVITDGDVILCKKTKKNAHLFQRPVMTQFLIDKYLAVQFFSA